MRYLLDELHLCETSYSDSLKPVQLETNVSFLGEHRQIKSATIADVELAIYAINSHVDLKLDYFLQQQCSGNSIVHPALSVHHPHQAIHRTGEYLCPPPPSSHHRFRISPATSITPKQPTVVSQLPVSTWPPGLSIPVISKKLPIEQRWREVIDWWRNPQPDIGLIYALKDWKPEWLKGQARVRYAARYSWCRDIALEYLEK
jgi:hypothetical protein